MKKIILFIIFIPCLLFSQIDVGTVKESSVLNYSQIALADKDYNFSGVKNLKFKYFDKKHISLGATKKALWIKIVLFNSSKKSVSKYLVISSPLTEEAVLYGGKKIQKSGILYNKTGTLYHSFKVTINPNEKKVYYLKIFTQYSLLDFSLYLKEPINYLTSDKKETFQNFYLIGILSALMIFSFLISIYMKDISFMLYGLYLLAIILQQTGYTGIDKFIFSKELLLVNLKYRSVKIITLIITGSLFAINFLKLKKFPKIYNFYFAVIAISLIELLFKKNSPIGIYAPIITGAFFIFLNLFSAAYVYIKGIKEARFYVTGFGIVSIAYLLMICDALNIFHVMERYHNILLFASSIEALILLLAFADRYIIIKQEKERVSAKLLDELANKHNEIQKEVEKKTKELNLALKEKELLLRELNHRVKNNLQIILSMINLQKSTLKTEYGKSSCEKIEQRINAIAHTYNSLMAADRFKTVDMSRYLKNLLNDLEHFFSMPNVKIETEISLNLPLKEAVYIGIIVNELVTNSFKYAFEENQNGIIKVKLYKTESKKILEVSDNGKGFDKNRKTDSLGLKLIYMLAKSQLKGKILFDTENKTYCKIVF